MSLESDVTACKLVWLKDPTVVRTLVGEALTSFTNLTAFLAKCKTAKDTLPLLVHEIENQKRISYINRIYGRYHRLLSKRDFEFIYRETGVKLNG